MNKFTICIWLFFCTFLIACKKNKTTSTPIPTTKTPVDTIRIDTFAALTSHGWLLTEIWYDKNANAARDADEITDYNERITYQTNGMTSDSSMHGSWGCGNLLTNIKMSS